MITTELFCCVPVGFTGNPASFSVPDTREVWEACLERRNRGPAKYELRPHITCQCCGADANYLFAGTHARCRKHVGRNPCMVEGCKRSGKVGHNGYGNDHLICGPHWRSFIPVGSPERRIYNRFFRRAKKYGWSDSSIDAFDRFWRALASRVRARVRGDLDMNEVNRIMGWD